MEGVHARVQQQMRPACGPLPLRLLQKRVLITWCTGDATQRVSAHRSSPEESRSVCALCVLAPITPTSSHTKAPWARYARYPREETM
jgi:hypothetical protein